MNLIIDIGNTRTKYCAFVGKELVATQAEAGCQLDGMDEFVSCTSAQQQQHFDGAIVSSTTNLPANAHARIEALPCPIITFNWQTPIPIANCYGTPQTLGTDRLASAIGAWSLHAGSELLIIDAGSCLTIDFVTADGTYLGGNISPGFRMRLDAMHEHTARLPLVDAEGAIPELGYDTETAIRAGALNGIRSEIEGYIHRFSAKYPDLLVFLTGGDEISLAKCEESRIFADPYLVARGLNHVLNYNLHLPKHQQ